MRDQYAGDISDYIKFSFLRTIVPISAVLGVAWYYVRGHDGRPDGQHTEYCSEDQWKKLDENLYFELCGLPVRSVRSLEQLAIWDTKTLFHRVPLQASCDRKIWTDEMCDTLSKSDFVFIDPDNGVSFENRVGEKHASFREISALANGGRPLVFIRFPHRMAKHLDQLSELHSVLKDYNPATLQTCVLVPNSKGGKTPKIRWFTLLNGDDESLANVRKFTKLLNSIENVVAKVTIERSQQRPHITTLRKGTTQSEPEGVKKDWTALLEEVIPSPCNDRPFVCDGDPEASKVMVIGENPATPTDKDWWSYWDIKTGFNYKDFKTDYDKEKEAKEKNPNNGVRGRFNHIRDKGVKCIETNVYRNENPDGAGKNKIKNTDLLKCLISNNENLRLIIVHGVKAQKGLGFVLANKDDQEVMGEFREKAQEVLGKLPKKVTLYATRHFTIEKNEEIYQILRDYLKGT
jgi:hypothetical protein